MGSGASAALSATISAASGDEIADALNILPLETVNKLKAVLTAEEPSSSSKPPATSPLTAMTVFIQQLGNPEPLTLDVDPQATLSHLKTLIRDTEEIPTSIALQLVLNEVLLDESMNGAALPDCGIHDETTLILVMHEIQHVLTGSVDATAKIWDASTGECKRTFSGHSEGVFSAVFSADGLSVLTGSQDKTAKIWDASTGECKRTFPGHSDAVWSAVFSEDGLSVLTGSEDETAKIWDASTGECKRTFSGHSRTVMSAAFSADGLSGQ